MINADRAIELLPDEQWIHLFITPGEREGAMWHRDKIIAMIKSNPVELHLKMAQHQHGICFNHDGKQFFIQNRLKPKEPGGSPTP
jgi:hypothetical protein